MAFPTTLDVLTNPSPGDTLGTTAVLHSAQHASVNDAIEAIEAKLGIDGSANASSIDYLVKVARPRGVLGRVQRLTDVIGIGTVATDVALMTLPPITIAANRVTRLTARVLPQPVGGSPGGAFVYITDSANVEAQRVVNGVSNTDVRTVSVDLALAAGAYTWKLRAHANGSGTLNLLAASGYPMQLTAEDIGAA